MRNVVSCDWKRISRLLLPLMVFAFVLPQSIYADWYLDAQFDPSSNLAIYEVAGDGFVAYEMVQEGVRADYGFGSIPVDFEFQQWDGSAWPEAFFPDYSESPDTLASAQAEIEQFEVFDELPFYMGASIGGEFNNGLGMAAGAALDFTLQVDPNTYAVVELFDVFADIDATTGSEGFGFAGVRIYDPTAGINDPGGVNDPLDHDFVFQTEGGASGESLSVLAEFNNLGNGSELIQELRIEVYTVVFTVAVPEPSSFVALGILACVLGTKRRRV